MNQKRQLETMFRSRKRIQTTQRCTDRTQWNHLQKCCSFFSLTQRHLVLANALAPHPGKNATEASIRMIAWRPGTTKDVQHFVSKCKNCQMNRPSLGIQFLRGQKPTFGNGSTWTGVMLRTKARSCQGF